MRFGKALTKLVVIFGVPVLMAQESFTMRHLPMKPTSTDT